ncbi:hypothetical protein BDF19DRAFT_411692 [Syncephalis fuscata]|nr:hypothetical protein BDF19DRAFT_411692 [Syncephalis fuscata]
MHSTKFTLIFAASVLAAAAITPSCNALPLRFFNRKCATNVDACLSVEQMLSNENIIKSINQLQLQNLIEEHFGFKDDDELAQWPSTYTPSGSGISKWSLEDSADSFGTTDNAIRTIMLRPENQHYSFLESLLSALDTSHQAVTYLPSGQEMHRLARRSEDFLPLLNLNALQSVSALNIVNEDRPQRRRSVYGSSNGQNNESPNSFAQLQADSTTLQSTNINTGNNKETMPASKAKSLTYSAVDNTNTQRARGDAVISNGYGAMAANMVNTQTVETTPSVAKIEAAFANKQKNIPENAAEVNKAASKGYNTQGEVNNVSEKITTAPSTASTPSSQSINASANTVHKSATEAPQYQPSTSDVNSSANLAFQVLATDEQRLKTNTQAAAYSTQPGNDSAKIAHPDLSGVHAENAAYGTQATNPPAGVLASEAGTVDTFEHNLNNGFTAQPATAILEAETNAVANEGHSNSDNIKANAYYNNSKQSPKPQDVPNNTNTNISQPPVPQATNTPASTRTLGKVQEQPQRPITSSQVVIPNQSTISATSSGHLANDESKPDTFIGHVNTPSVTAAPMSYQSANQLTGTITHSASDIEKKPLQHDNKQQEKSQAASVSTSTEQSSSAPNPIEHTSNTNWKNLQSDQGAHLAFTAEKAPFQKPHGYATNSLDTPQVDAAVESRPSAPVFEDKMDNNLRFLQFVATSGPSDNSESKPLKAYA